MQINIRIFGILALLMLVATSAVSTVMAQESAVSSEDVSLVAAFRSIQPTSDDSDIDLIVTNHSSERRVARFEFKGIPEGWDVQVWQRYFSYRLDVLALEPSGSPDDGNKQEPRLRITPPADSKAGKYQFSLEVLSEDGAVKFDEANFTVSLPERTPVETGNVEVATTFPYLQGPTASRFEFEIAIKNKTGADASFDLSAAAPLNWAVQFLPAYGDERLISNVSPINNATQRVKVRVTPARFADADTYSIPVTVSNDTYNTEIGLQVQITGQGQLSLDTVATVLSFDATAGEKSQVDLVIGNIGTDELTNVTMIAAAPDGWVVSFDKESFPSVGVADFLPVAALITPDKDAIPGDYLINIIARSPDDLREATLRITVSQSTIWGWLGIVIVIAVLGGLGGLFWRLGRR